jgi:hypothetical protein
MTRRIEIWKPLQRGLLAAAVAAVGWSVPGAAPPAQASGLYIYDTSHYRPVHGRARSVFRNPVGKLGPGVTRRLPTLTPKPAEFDYGAEPVKIESSAEVAARARRTNSTAPTPPAPPTTPALPATPALPELTGPKKNP